MGENNQNMSSSNELNNEKYYNYQTDPWATGLANNNQKKSSWEINPQEVMEQQDNPFVQPQPVQQQNVQPNPFGQPQPVQQQSVQPNPFVQPQPVQQQSVQPNPFVQPQPVQQQSVQPNPFVQPQPVQQQNVQPNPFVQPQPVQQQSVQPNPFVQPQPVQQQSVQPNPFRQPQPVQSFVNNNSQSFNDMSTSTPITKTISEYQNVLNNSSDKKINGKKIIIIALLLIIVILLAIVFIISNKNPDSSSTTENITEEITPEQKDPIIENQEPTADDSLVKINSEAFISEIEKYSNFSAKGISGYEIQVPIAVSGDVTCITRDGVTWTGNVATGSETCDNFLKTINKRIVTLKIEEAKIIFDATGKVKKGTWIKNNNLYCIYDGTSITSACTAKKPE